MNVITPEIAASIITTKKTHAAKKITGIKKDAINAIAAKQIAASVTAIISNVQEYLDELHTLAASNGYFAQNSIVNSLGFYCLNQLLWNYRKAKAKTKLVVACGIDPFNDGSAEQDEAVSKALNMVEIGFDAQLPTFDATPLIGIYKKLFRAQASNVMFCQKSPPRQPIEILSDMLNNDNTTDTKAAYDAFTKKQSDCTSAMLQAERAKQQQLKTLREAASNKIEAEYILTEMQKTMQGELTDDLWNTVPLWLQYKWTVGVMQQAVKAIVFIENTEEFPDASYDRLKTLVQTMYLECDLASRDPQVKTAFGLGKLDERHELIKAEVEKKPAEHGLTTLLANNMKSKLVRRVPHKKDEPDTGIVGLVSTQPATQPAITPLH